MLGSAGILMAQGAEHSPHGNCGADKVHGKALEGNLEGDSPDRDVSIYLPPSYASERNRRYPVIYLLHGYTDSDDLWFGSKPHFINVPAVTDKALVSSGAREMIIVMPNAYTAYQGSMYSSSPAIRARPKSPNRLCSFRKIFRSVTERINAVAHALLRAAFTLV